VINNKWMQRIKRKLTIGNFSKSTIKKEQETKEDDKISLNKKNK